MRLGNHWLSASGRMLVQDDGRAPLPSTLEAVPAPGEFPMHAIERDTTLQIIQDVTVLDVRSKQEFDSGHVPGARHLPFWAVPFRASRVIPSRIEPVTVYCGHGPRAWIAKSLLRAAGFRHVRLLRGHMRAWIRAGKPLE